MLSPWSREKTCSPTAKAPLQDSVVRDELLDPPVLMVTRQHPTHGFDNRFIGQRITSFRFRCFWPRSSNCFIMCS